jgi:hypothetical protein
MSVKILKYFDPIRLRSNINFFYSPFYTDIISHCLNVGLTRNIQPTNIKSSGLSSFSLDNSLVSILNFLNNITTDITKAAIFSNNKGNLELITETPINLEKDIQKLVEENMKTIFHLDFIASEYALNDLRVDSLGYDQESQSFVIIEYKRDKNLSVIDQGFAYLALLLNNKADFTLLYNQKTSKSLKITQKR